MSNKSVAFTELSARSSFEAFPFPDVFAPFAGEAILEGPPTGFIALDGVFGFGGDMGPGVS
jgi:hypothetical protein